jgi:hypothetical protein
LRAVRVRGPNGSKLSRLLLFHGWAEKGEWKAGPLGGLDGWLGWIRKKKKWLFY